MKMKKDSTKAPYYISKPVKRMLEKSKELVINKDWDRVFIIDGGEGSGKSLLGLQLGAFLDPTLNLNNVTFTGEDFGKAIDNANKNQCIIFDEAFNGLSSTAAMSKMNRFIVRKLMECRQKNLFIIIILPTLFLLQKYVAIFRSRALFHVYVTKSGTRGYYRVYNEANKKTLFLNGQKMYSYSRPYIKNNHIFRGKYPLDEQKYRAKKSQALIYEDKPTDTTKYRDKYHRMVAIFRKFSKKSEKETARILKEHGIQIEDTQVGVITRKYRETSLKTPLPLTPSILYY